MRQSPENLENIKKIPSSNYELLENIIKKLGKIINGKRDIMYSDIINLIIREGHIGEKYSQLILWCNYMCISKTHL
jgi:hypothetical protein